MLSRVVKSAPAAWNCLNGVVTVYKPADVTTGRVRNSILVNLCRDLNEIDDRQPKNRVSIEIDRGESYMVKQTVDLADHILSVGPRYLIEDFKCIAPSPLGIHTSGVLLFGINKGTSTAVKISENKPIRAYHVKGEFGVATETHFEDSRITAKATFRHVNKGFLTSLVSSMQASHQRKMYELCGVDLQSQAAYELASRGLIRPNNNQIPIIYGIKVIEFKKPEFKLEIHAVNEDESYLATLIHEIGIEMRTVAKCTGIQCIRHGFFTIEESLLRRHWTLPGVISNIQISRKILEDHPTMLYCTNSEFLPS